MKNKSGLTKCENFCKNDYTLEMEKVSKEFHKKYSKGTYNPTKSTKEINYNACKKKFCNENCDGILNDKQQQLEYLKKINNGFSESYSKDKIEKLKSRGALSGCIYVTDYDIYHK